MLRTPLASDPICQWFSVKLSGYLSAKGCLELKDLERILHRVNTIPGIGKAGIARIHEVWKAMDAGYGLPLIENDESSLDGQFDPAVMPKPTRHPPGSQEKIEELARRVQENLVLFHHEDISYEDAVRDWSMARMSDRLKLAREGSTEGGEDE